MLAQDLVPNVDGKVPSRTTVPRKAGDDHREATMISKKINRRRFTDLPALRPIRERD